MLGPLVELSLPVPPGQKLLIPQEMHLVPEGDGFSFLPAGHAAGHKSNIRSPPGYVI
jgi:hypothetical protein